MNTKRIYLAVLVSSAILLPSIAMAQMDPNNSPGSSPYPSTSPGMTQTGGPQPGTPGGSSQQTQPGSMRDSLGAPGETGRQMMDQQFVRMAAESGVADVKLGTLATEKGSPSVKELAQKLVDDHVAMNKELDNIADAIGIMLPKKMNKDGQREYDKLNALSGKDFDTEYLNYLMKVHFEQLHSYHMEAAVAANQELAEDVVKDMGMMHQHLGSIVNTAKEEGITLPPRPPRPAPTTASK